MSGRLATLSAQGLPNLPGKAHAFEYTYDRPYKYQAAFQQAEQDAQVRQAGLWSPQTCNGELLPATPGP